MSTDRGDSTAAEENMRRINGAGRTELEPAPVVEDALRGQKLFRRADEIDKIVLVGVGGRSTL